MYPKRRTSTFQKTETEFWLFLSSRLWRGALRDDTRNSCVVDYLQVNWLIFRQDKRKLNVLDSPTPSLQCALSLLSSSLPEHMGVHTLTS